ncbi:hypothetical protein V5O48_005929 [Marasmius crinis-equi]|uniref:F-box domain-containing protein n=1 Tax=Marasmius crinis-equi TaxID=585013 RepID=A0ABR3FKX2_9AGAR
MSSTPTLKRRHRQDLTLRKSFLDNVKTKFMSSISKLRENKTQQPCRIDSASNYDMHDSFHNHNAHILHPSPSKRRKTSIVRQTTHHIGTLPPEILAHIFVLGSFADPHFPVTVSHVCRFWRHLSLRTPSLWRTIHLSNRTPALREKMLRARACSLDIVIREFPSRPFNFYEVQRYMCFATAHLHRWRSLDIKISNYVPYLWNAALSECCSSHHSQAPTIEELSLVYRRNDDTKEFCLFSGYAPRLRRLTIDGLRLTWLPSLFCNLVYLDYTHHPFSTGNQAVNEIINALTVSSRLVELHLSYPTASNPRRNSRVASVAGKIRLSRLKTLSLRVESFDIPDELIQVAAALFTPNLVNLDFVDSFGRYASVGACRASFANLPMFLTLYSFPTSLRALRFDHRWYNEGIVPLLRPLVNLTTVVVRPEAGMDRIFYGSTKRRVKPRRQRVNCS